MNGVTLLVIAKEPVAGRVKTRLTPPCTPAQAAALAGAALRDTIEAVRLTPAARRILVFEGDPTRWRPPGFELVLQRGDGLAERLQAAFDDAGGPGVLIGMDTPQVTPARLSGAVRALSRPGVDAVLGPTPDGGYWSVGFAAGVPRAFAGVPMSTPTTCAQQRDRFGELGLTVAEQPPLRDVDTISDALAVAAQAPRTRFARALAAML